MNHSPSNPPSRQDDLDFSELRGILEGGDDNSGAAPQFGRQELPTAPMDQAVQAQMASSLLSASTRPPSPSVRPPSLFPKRTPTPAPTGNSDRPTRIPTPPPASTAAVQSAKGTGKLRLTTGVSNSVKPSASAGSRISSAPTSAPPAPESTAQKRPSAPANGSLRIPAPAASAPSVPAARDSQPYRAKGSEKPISGPRATENDPVHHKLWDKFISKEHYEFFNSASLRNNLSNNDSRAFENLKTLLLDKLKLAFFIRKRTEETTNPGAMSRCLEEIHAAIEHAIQLAGPEHRQKITILAGVLKTGMSDLLRSLISEMPEYAGLFNTTIEKFSTISPEDPNADKISEEARNALGKLVEGWDLAPEIREELDKVELMLELGLKKKSLERNLDGKSPAQKRNEIEKRLDTILNRIVEMFADMRLPTPQLRKLFLEKIQEMLIETVGKYSSLYDSKFGKSSFPPAIEAKKSLLPQQRPVDSLPLEAKTTPPPPGVDIEQVIAKARGAADDMGHFQGDISDAYAAVTGPQSERASLRAAPLGIIAPGFRPSSTDSLKTSSRERSPTHRGLGDPSSPHADVVAHKEQLDAAKAAGSKDGFAPRERLITMESETGVGTEAEIAEHEPKTNRGIGDFQSPQGVDGDAYAAAGDLVDKHGKLPPPVVTSKPKLGTSYRMVGGKVVEDPDDRRQKTNPQFLSGPPVLTEEARAHARAQAEAEANASRLRLVPAQSSTGISGANFKRVPAAPPAVPPRAPSGEYHSRRKIESDKPKSPVQPGTEPGDLRSAPTKKESGKIPAVKLEAETRRDSPQAFRAVMAAEIAPQTLDYKAPPKPDTSGFSGLDNFKARIAAHKAVPAKTGSTKMGLQPPTAPQQNSGMQSQPALAPTQEFHAAQAGQAVSEPLLAPKFGTPPPAPARISTPQAAKVLPPPPPSFPKAPSPLFGDTDIMAFSGPPRSYTPPMGVPQQAVSPSRKPSSPRSAAIPLATPSGSFPMSPALAEALAPSSQRSLKAHDYLAASNAKTLTADEFATQAVPNESLADFENALAEADKQAAANFAAGLDPDTLDKYVPKASWEPPSTRMPVPPIVAPQAPVSHAAPLFSTARESGPVDPARSAETVTPQLSTPSRIARWIQNAAAAALITTAAVGAYFGGKKGIDQTLQSSQTTFAAPSSAPRIAPRPTPRPAQTAASTVKAAPNLTAQASAEAQALASASAAATASAAPSASAPLAPTAAPQAPAAPVVTPAVIDLDSSAETFDIKEGMALTTQIFAQYKQVHKMEIAKINSSLALKSRLEKAASRYFMSLSAGLTKVEKMTLVATLPDSDPAKTSAKRNMDGFAPASLKLTEKDLQDPDMQLFIKFMDLAKAQGINNVFAVDKSVTANFNIDALMQ